MAGYDSVIVSKSPLFTDAVRYILKEENLKITSVIPSLKKPPLCVQNQTTTIIIDGDDDAHLTDLEFVSKLHETLPKFQIVSLSMKKNQMILLRCECIPDVTATMLIEAIKNQQ